MKFSDGASGVLAMLIGVFVVAYARTFPAAQGGPVGPAFFPSVIGVALIGTGAVLVLSTLRQRPRLPWIELQDWARTPHLVSNVGLVLGALVFYAAAVNILGFIITAIVFLTMLFAAFGVRRTTIAPLAVALTVVIHYAFYSLLRVPLPWGILEGVAW